MKTQKTRQQRKKSAYDWFLRVTLCVFIIIAIVLVGMQIRSKYVFLQNTFINQVNCSNLSVKQAEKKIKNELFDTATIQFSYGDDRFVVTLSKLNPSLNKTDLAEDLKQIMREQDSFKNLPFQEEAITNLYSVDVEALKKFLERTGFGSSSNFNAQIEWNSEKNKYVIVDELANVGMTLDQMTDYTVNNINNGVTNIDFKKLQKSLWSERKDTLVESLNHINPIIVDTNLQFVLNGETICSLDASTIKNWVKMDDEGQPFIQIDGNVEEFVAKVAQIVENKKHPTYFQPSGLDRQIEIDGLTNYVIDQDKYSNWIKSNLGETQETTISAKATPLSDYIELDITRQTVWLYRNGECIMASPCVTGNVATGHGTRTGVFSVYEMTTDETLRGYENDGTPYTSHVDRWMEFDNGNGFHDAKWRYGVFGGDIYKTDGSHGCVNMPVDKAKFLYSNIWLGYTVIIYKS